MSAKRYPGSPITPHGWYHLTNGSRPMMGLEAWDESLGFDLLGPLAPPLNDPEYPEAVVVRDLKGLIPPWRHIDQKGATEDGVLHVDALLDPIEAEMVVECIGRDGRHVRRVHRDLIASLDAIRESKLWFFDLDAGFWWSPVRWFKGAPPDPVANPQTRRQRTSLRLRADSACWQTFDHTAQFRFTYDSMVDEFDVDHSATQDLGDLPQYYIGDGEGYCSTTTAADGYEQMRWYESGNDALEVVNGPYPDFDTDTDNQVIEIELGTFPELTLPGGAFNDVWGRQNRNPDGTWAGDGVRGRVGLSGIFGWVELTWWVDFTMIRRWYRPMIIPPWPRAKFSLVCGVEGDPRMYRVLRNGLPILSHKETGAPETLSLIDEEHRGVGHGMAAGAGILSQASPAWVRRFNAGDNATVKQSGFLERVNIGDQPMLDDYTLFGPGLFRIYDGPGSDEYIEFGPVQADQIVFLRTDPRSHTSMVEDLTVTPRTPQQLTFFQSALDKFLTFAGMQGAFGDQIKSLFGIRTPQGNLYRYLNGRFSENAKIPPKSPGNPAQTYYVKVEIDDGNADSKIIASGTPRRRYPL